MDENKPKKAGTWMTIESSDEAQARERVQQRREAEHGQASGGLQSSVVWIFSSQPMGGRLRNGGSLAACRRNVHDGIFFLFLFPERFVACGSSRVWFGRGGFAPLTVLQALVLRMRVEGVQARFGSAMELQFCSCWLILIACLTPWVLIDAQRKCPTNNVASFAVQTPSHLGSDVGAQPPIQSVTLANLRDTSTPIVYDRTSSLKNRSQFSFVHISKCSGASFIQWARSKNNLRSDGSRTFPDFFPKYPQGVEVGNFYDRQRRASWVRLTFLRSPRSHVMSLFKECRFDKWGLEVIETQERNGRLAVPHTGTHMEDFRNWIDYFVARNDTYVRAGTWLHHEHENIQSWVLTEVSFMHVAKNDRRFVVPFVFFLIWTIEAGWDAIIPGITNPVL